MKGKREPPAPLAVLFGRLARNHPAARAVGPLRRRPGAERSRAWTWPRSRNRSAAAHGAASHAIEVDPKLAESLSSRLRGSNVRVVTGDATALLFPDAHFSGGVSFTMLHHLPSREMQDKLLREVWRVFKPGGVFVGSDSLQSLFMD
jgi:SAM-dependent methyltransferase